MKKTRISASEISEKDVLENVPEVAEAKAEVNTEISDPGSANSDPRPTIPVVTHISVDGRRVEFDHQPTEQELREAFG